MDKKPIEYPVTEEEIGVPNKEKPGTYTPPRKYSIPSQKGDSDDSSAFNNGG